MDLKSKINWLYKILSGLPPSKSRVELERVAKLRAGHATRANALAKRVGVTIPDQTHVPLWSLPILEQLVTRIELLEEEK